MLACDIADICVPDVLAVTSGRPCVEYCALQQDLSLAYCMLNNLSVMASVLASHATLQRRKLSGTAWRLREIVCTLFVWSSADAAEIGEGHRKWLPKGVLLACERGCLLRLMRSGRGSTLPCRPGSMRSNIWSSSGTAGS